MTGAHSAQDGTDPELEHKLGAAARSSAFGKVADSATTGHALLAAMGGWRGIVEALLPGILFLTLYVITGAIERRGGELWFGMDALWLAVLAPAVAGVAFVIIRAIRREPMAAAAGGLLGLLLSGFLALRSGEGTDYFIVGFWTNGAYALVFVISMLVGWPLIGLVAGGLYGSLREWRTAPGVKTWMQIITGVWVVFFLVRLAVQLPLYFAGAVEALGVARLLMGPPLFAVLVVVTVLYVRAVFKPLEDARQGESAGTAPADSSQV